MGTILFLAPQAALRALAQAAPANPSGQTPPQLQAPEPGPAPIAMFPPDEVVLTVGDVKITAKAFDELTMYLPPEVASVMPGLGKRGFAERYANLLGLAQQGEKLQVDKSASFLHILEFQRIMLLAQLTVNQLASSVTEPTPDEVKSYYTAHQSDFSEIRVRGIYISFGAADEMGQGAQAAGDKSKPPSKPKLTEAEARTKAETLRNRIKAGEDMAAIAKKESEHASAAQGGDLGFVRHNQFSPQIDTVIFSLPLKQVSEPVRDRFGYFLYQVEEKRVPPLEQVQTNIENSLRQQKMGGVLSKVQAATSVVLNPRFFGEPPAMPGSAPSSPQNK